MILSFEHPDGGIFRFDTELFGQIEPDKCTVKALSSKVEVVLKKADGISWPTIEPNDTVTSWTTFGITGKVGSIGGREMHLARDSPLYRNKAS